MRLANLRRLPVSMDCHNLLMSPSVVSTHVAERCEYSTQACKLLYPLPAGRSSHQTGLSVTANRSDEVHRAAIGKFEIGKYVPKELMRGGQ